MRKAMLRVRAAGLRSRLTPPEAILWRVLKGRGLNGLKFRRQHPMGRYILDFYCPERRLCIEVDGSQHDWSVEEDAARDAWLAGEGVRTIRLPAATLLEGDELVLAWLREAIDHLPSSPA